MCKYHENEAVEYYCLQCEVCICQICGQIRHKHHTKVEIQQAAEERKVVMAKILNEAKAEIVAFEDKVNKQIELRNESKARMAATESRVTETVEELIQALRDEEKTVKEKLIAIDEEQEKDHAAQLEKFQMFATELKTSVEQGEEIFQRDIATEILQEENVVFAACKELVSQSQKIQVHKPEDVDYVVNTGNVTARLIELVQQRLDQVVVHGDHSQSVAEGKGLKDAELGSETNFTVTTRDSEGKQFYSEQEQVTVTISSPTGEEEVQITDCKDGNYTVHYKPRSVGRHDVAIDVNGWPLTGSPWRVDVKPHQYKVVNSCGSRGKREGEFEEPWSIAKNEKTGNIAVADYGNKRVQVFDENLKYLRTIGGGTGSQTGAAVKIGRPTSVAFLRNGDMIVIHDDKESKMSVITDGGQFIEQFSEHVINPICVFVKTDDDGHVIVCDPDDYKIKVLSSDGAELLQSFSASDSFSAPIRVFYHHDMFFVSYHFAHSVKVFSKGGVFLYNIGREFEKSGKGQFNYPEGLVVDSFHNLIVCDSDNHRLQMFTLDGKFLTSFGQEIQAPWAATVCKNGDLLVTDKAQDSVFVFR